MVSASQRDVLVVVQRKEIYRDDLNQAEETWRDYARGYASIRYGSGVERLQAAQVAGTQGCTIRVLATPKMLAVTIKDRIAERGSVWNIVGVSRIGREDIEFSCLREVG